MKKFLRGDNEERNMLKQTSTTVVTTFASDGDNLTLRSKIVVILPVLGILREVRVSPSGRLGVCIAVTMNCSCVVLSGGGEMIGKRDNY